MTTTGRPPGARGRGTPAASRAGSTSGGAASGSPAGPDVRPASGSAASRSRPSGFPEPPSLDDVGTGVSGHDDQPDEARDQPGSGRRRPQPPRTRPADHPDPAARRRASRPTPDAVQAARAHRRRGLRRLAVALAVLVAVPLAGYVLLFSSVFGARSVDVAGNGLLTADEVRAAAAVPPGAPLLRLDVGAVAARVAALPAVSTVQVQRAWPTGVTIRIAERVPLAYAPAPGGAILVDRDGVEFATVPAPPAGVPELRAASADATRAAAAVLAVLAAPGREGLRAGLVALRADSPFAVELAFTQGRTVRWGSSADSPRKAAVLAALLTQPGTVYDVASPDLPTIR